MPKTVNYIVALGYKYYYEYPFSLAYLDMLGATRDFEKSLVRKSTVSMESTSRSSLGMVVEKMQYTKDWYNGVQQLLLKR